jgi:ribosomal protein S18 acetylase RimI-like enzyme
MKEIVCLMFISFTLLLILNGNINSNSNTNTNNDIYDIKPIHMETFSDIKRNKKSINNSIVNKCFSAKELNTFNKYKKYSERYVFKEDNIEKGEIWVTPSKYINEIPQITMNGYYINNVCVLKEYRRQGIATKLMKWIIRKARKDDMLHLILQVDSNKEYLSKLYNNVGFTTYIKGIDPISQKSIEVMTLAL